MPDDKYWKICHTSLIALKERNEIGSFNGCDKRGKHVPDNKTPDCKINLVRCHIKSIPKMESHYCRKDSQKQYIDTNLTLPKLYEAYLKWLIEKSLESQPDVDYNPVSESKYRDIFTNDFNISCFHPKKDQCMICTTWNNLTVEEQKTRQPAKDDHERHRKEVDDFRDETEKACLKDPSRRMTTFDLEAVLQLPCGHAAQLFYKRKLCVYNLTFYEKPGGRGVCYLWSETEGKRGSDEIGTCLFKYLLSLPDHVRKIDILSDNCSGQNKNVQIIAMCLYAIEYIKHLDVITHTFLETGHTHMECDSMHSAIESAQKNLKVHSMGQWESILSMARKKMPYKVQRLQFSDFLDLKCLVKEMIVNKSKDVQGETVNWRNIRSMRYSSSSIVEYKYNLTDNFIQLDTSVSSAKVC